MHALCSWACVHAWKDLKGCVHSIFYTNIFYDHFQICFFQWSKWISLNHQVCMHALSSCAWVHAWNGLKSCVHSYFYIKIFFLFSWPLSNMLPSLVKINMSKWPSVHSCFELLCMCARMKWSEMLHVFLFLYDRIILFSWLLTNTPNFMFFRGAS